MKSLIRVSALTTLAVLVLFVSLAQTSRGNYSFAASPKPTNLKNNAEGIDVVYGLPYPGKIGPDSVLWPIKVIRDRLLLVTQNEGSAKAAYLLHLADKRLGNAVSLWEHGEGGESIAAFAKAEMYLSHSLIELRSSEEIDGAILKDIHLASLKHRQFLEQILAECDDNSRILVNEIIKTPKSVYEESLQLLHEEGLPPVENPFAR